MKKSLLKLASLVTLITFVGQELAPLPLGHAVEIQTPAAISIPENIGKLEGPVSPAGQKTIFHIQDAHGNEDAQRNIQQILSHLASHFDQKIILLEGGHGKLHPELLHFFPEDPELNLKIADSLLKKAELSGGERFLLSMSLGGASQLRQSNPIAYGIENIAAYRENREAFQKVLRARETTSAFLSEMDDQIKRLSAPHLNPFLKDFLKKSEAYEAGLTDFIHWHLFLKEQAKKYLEIDLDDPFHQREWPMLVRLSRLQKNQGKIRQDKIDTEKKEFLKKLRSLKIKADLTRRIEAILSLDKAAASFPYQDTLNAFGELLEILPADFSFKPYENLRRMIQSQILESELKSDLLADETEKLEAQLQEKLVKGEIERRILAFYKNYGSLKKLFRLELTLKEYQTLSFRSPEGAEKSQGQAIKPSFLIRQFLEINSGSRVKNVFFRHLDEIDRLYDLALSFYAGARKRDELMAGNALKAMRHLDRESAVIVTGGFHTQGMKEYFESKGFSYHLITPRIHELGGNKAYLDAMLAGKSHIALMLKLQRRAKILAEAGPDYGKHLTGLIRSELRTIPDHSGLDLSLLEKQYRIQNLNSFAIRSETRSTRAPMDFGAWVKSRHPNFPERDYGPLTSDLIHKTLSDSKRVDAALIQKLLASGLTYNQLTQLTQEGLAGKPVYSVLSGYKPSSIVASKEYETFSSPDAAAFIREKLSNRSEAGYLLKTEISLEKFDLIEEEIKNKFEIEIYKMTGAQTWRLKWFFQRGTREIKNLVIVHLPRAAAVIAAHAEHFIARVSDKKTKELLQQFKTSYDREGLSESTKQLLTTLLPFFYKNQNHFTGGILLGYPLDAVEAYSDTQTAVPSNEFIEYLKENHPGEEGRDLIKLISGVSLPSFVNIENYLKTTADWEIGFQTILALQKQLPRSEMRQASRRIAVQDALGVPARSEMRTQKVETLEESRLFFQSPLASSIDLTRLENPETILSEEIRYQNFINSGERMKRLLPFGIFSPAKEALEEFILNALKASKSETVSDPTVKARLEFYPEAKIFKLTLEQDIMAESDWAELVQKQKELSPPGGLEALVQAHENERAKGPLYFSKGNGFYHLAQWMLKAPVILIYSRTPERSSGRSEILFQPSPAPEARRSELRSEEKIEFGTPFLRSQEMEDLKKSRLMFEGKLDFADYSQEYLEYDGWLGLDRLESFKQLSLEARIIVQELLFNAFKSMPDPRASLHVELRASNALVHLKILQQTGAHAENWQRLRENEQKVKANGLKYLKQMDARRADNTLQVGGRGLFSFASLVEETPAYLTYQKPISSEALQTDLYFRLPRSGQPSARLTLRADHDDPRSEMRTDFEDLKSRAKELASNFRFKETNEQSEASLNELFREWLVLAGLSGEETVSGFKSPNAAYLFWQALAHPFQAEALSALESLLLAVHTFHNQKAKQNDKNRAARLFHYRYALQPLKALQILRPSEDNLHDLAVNYFHLDELSKAERISLDLLHQNNLPRPLLRAARVLIGYIKAKKAWQHYRKGRQKLAIEQARDGAAMFGLVLRDYRRRPQDMRQIARALTGLSSVERTMMLSYQELLQSEKTREGAAAMELEITGHAVNSLHASVQSLLKARSNASYKHSLQKSYEPLWNEPFPLEKVLDRLVQTGTGPFQEKQILTLKKNLDQLETLLKGKTLWNESYTPIVPAADARAQHLLAQIKILRDEIQFREEAKQKIVRHGKDLAKGDYSDVSAFKDELELFVVEDLTGLEEKRRAEFFQDLYARFANLSLEELYVLKYAMQRAKIIKSEWFRQEDIVEIAKSADEDLATLRENHVPLTPDTAASLIQKPFFKAAGFGMKPGLAAPVSAASAAAVEIQIPAYKDTEILSYGENDPKRWKKIVARAERLAPWTGPVRAATYQKIREEADKQLGFFLDEFQKWKKHESADRKSPHRLTPQIARVVKERLFTYRMGEGYFPLMMELERMLENDQHFVQTYLETGHAQGREAGNALQHSENAFPEDFSFGFYGEARIRHYEEFIKNFYEHTRFAWAAIALQEMKEIGRSIRQIRESEKDPHYLSFETYRTVIQKANKIYLEIKNYQEANSAKIEHMLTVMKKLRAALAQIRSMKLTSEQKKFFADSLFRLNTKTETLVRALQNTPRDASYWERTEKAKTLAAAAETLLTRANSINDQMQRIHDLTAALESQQTLLDQNGLIEEPPADSPDMDWFQKTKTAQEELTKAQRKWDEGQASLRENLRELDKEISPALETIQKITTDIAKTKKDRILQEWKKPFTLLDDFKEHFLSAVFPEGGPALKSWQELHKAVENIPSASNQNPAAIMNSFTSLLNAIHQAIEMDEYVKTQSMIEAFVDAARTSRFTQQDQNTAFNPAGARAVLKRNFELSIRKTAYGLPQEPKLSLKPGAFEDQSIFMEHVQLAMRTYRSITENQTFGAWQKVDLNEEILRAYRHELMAYALTFSFYLRMLQGDFKGSAVPDANEVMQKNFELLFDRQRNFLETQSRLASPYLTAFDHVRRKAEKHFMMFDESPAALKPKAAHLETVFDSLGPKTLFQALDFTSDLISAEDARKKAPEEVTQKLLVQIPTADSDLLHQVFSDLKTNEYLWHHAETVIRILGEYGLLADSETLAEFPFAEKALEDIFRELDRIQSEKPMETPEEFNLPVNADPEAVGKIMTAVSFLFENHNADKLASSQKIQEIIRLAVLINPAFKTKVEIKEPVPAVSPENQARLISEIQWQVLMPLHLFMAKGKIFPIFGHTWQKSQTESGPAWTVKIGGADEEKNIAFYNGAVQFRNPAGVRQGAINDFSNLAGGYNAFPVLKDKVHSLIKAKGMNPQGYYKQITLPMYGARGRRNIENFYYTQLRRPETDLRTDPWYIYLTLSEILKTTSPFYQHLKLIPKIFSRRAEEIPLLWFTHTLSYMISEIKAALRDQDPDLASLIFLDQLHHYYFETSPNSLNESIILTFFKDLADEAGIPLQNLDFLKKEDRKAVLAAPIKQLLEKIEGKPELVLSWLEKIYAKHFWTDEERRERLKSGAPLADPASEELSQSEAMIRDFYRPPAASRKTIGAAAEILRELSRQPNPLHPSNIGSIETLSKKMASASPEVNAAQAGAIARAILRNFILQNSKPTISDEIKKLETYRPLETKILLTRIWGVSLVFYLEKGQEQAYLQAEAPADRETLLELARAIDPKLADLFLKIPEQPLDPDAINSLNYFLLPAGMVFDLFHAPEIKNSLKAVLYFSGTDRKLTFLQTGPHQQWGLLGRPVRHGNLDSFSTRPILAAVTPQESIDKLSELLTAWLKPDILKNDDRRVKLKEAAASFYTQSISTALQKESRPYSLSSAAAAKLDLFFSKSQKWVFEFLPSLNEAAYLQKIQEHLYRRELTFSLFNAIARGREWKNRFGEEKTIQLRYLFAFMTLEKEFPPAAFDALHFLLSEAASHPAHTHLFQLIAALLPETAPLAEISDPAARFEKMAEILSAADLESWTPEVLIKRAEDFMFKTFGENLLKNFRTIQVKMPIAEVMELEKNKPPYAESPLTVEAKGGEMDILFSNMLTREDFLRIEPRLKEIVRKAHRNPKRYGYPEVYLLFPGSLGESELTNAAAERLFLDEQREEFKAAYELVKKRREGATKNTDHWPPEKRAAEGEPAEANRFFKALRTWAIKEGVRWRTSGFDFELWFDIKKNHKELLIVTRHFFKDEPGAALSKLRTYFHNEILIEKRQLEEAKEKAQRFLSEVSKDIPKPNVLLMHYAASSANPETASDVFQPHEKVIKQRYMQNAFTYPEEEQELLAKTAFEMMLYKITPSDWTAGHLTDFMTHLFKSLEEKGVSAPEAFSRMSRKLGETFSGGTPVPENSASSFFLKALKDLEWISPIEYEHFIEKGGAIRDPRSEMREMSASTSSIALAKRSETRKEIPESRAIKLLSMKFLNTLAYFGIMVWIAGITAAVVIVYSEILNQFYNQYAEKLIDRTALKKIRHIFLYKAITPFVFLSFLTFLLLDSIPAWFIAPLIYNAILAIQNIFSHPVTGFKPFTLSEKEGKTVKAINPKLNQTLTLLSLGKFFAAGGPIAAILWAASVVYHELGHYIVASKFARDDQKAGREDIEKVSVDFLEPATFITPKHEFGRYLDWRDTLMTFAGPLSNFILALAFLAAGAIGETFPEWAIAAIGINLYGFLGNLIPYYNTDGQLILGAWRAKKLSAEIIVHYPHISAIERIRFPSFSPVKGTPFYFNYIFRTKDGIYWIRRDDGIHPKTLKLKYWAQTTVKDSYAGYDVNAQLEKTKEDAETISVWGEKYALYKILDFPESLLGDADKALSMKTRSELRSVQDSSDKELIQILKNSYGIAANQLSPLMGGAESQIHGFPPVLVEASDGKKYVFRKLGANLDRARYIVAFMKHLHAKGLPVPHVYERTDIKEAPADKTIFIWNQNAYALEDYLEGGDKITKEQATAQHYYNLGAMAAKINNAARDFAPEARHLWKERREIALDFDLAKFSEKPHAAEIADLFKQNLQTFLSRYNDSLRGQFADTHEAGSPRNSHLHNDLRLSNVLFNKAGHVVAVFDFASQEDHRIVEFNNLLRGEGGPFDPGMLEAVIAGYQSKAETKLTPAEITGIWEILRLRNLEDVYRELLAGNPQDFTQSVENLKRFTRLPAPSMVDIPGAGPLFYYSQSDLIENLKLAARQLRYPGFTATGFQNQIMGQYVDEKNSLQMFSAAPRNVQGLQELIQKIFFRPELPSRDFQAEIAKLPEMARQVYQTPNASPKTIGAVIKIFERLLKEKKPITAETIQEVKQWAEEMAWADPKIHIDQAEGISTGMLRAFQIEDRQDPLEFYRVMLNLLGVPAAQTKVNLLFVWGRLLAGYLTSLQSDQYRARFAVNDQNILLNFSEAIDPELAQILTKLIAHGAAGPTWWQSFSGWAKPFAALFMIALTPIALAILIFEWYQNRNKPSPEEPVSLDSLQRALNRFLIPAGTYLAWPEERKQTKEMTEVRFYRMAGNDDLHLIRAAGKEGWGLAGYRIFPLTDPDRKGYLGMHFPADEVFATDLSYIKEAVLPAATWLRPELFQGIRSAENLSLDLKLIENFFAFKAEKNEKFKAFDAKTIEQLDSSILSLYQKSYQTFRSHPAANEKDFLDALIKDNISTNYHHELYHLFSTLLKFEDPVSEEMKARLFQILMEAKHKQASVHRTLISFIKEAVGSDDFQHMEHGYEKIDLDTSGILDALMPEANAPSIAGEKNLARRGQILADKLERFKLHEMPAQEIEKRIRDFIAETFGQDFLSKLDEIQKFKITSTLEVLRRAEEEKPRYAVAPIGLPEDFRSEMRTKNIHEAGQELEKIKQAISNTIDWLIAQGYPHPDILREYQNAAKTLSALSSEAAKHGIHFSKSLSNQPDGTKAVHIKVNVDHLSWLLETIQKINSQDYYYLVFATTIIREAWGLTSLKWKQAKHDEFIREGMALHQEVTSILKTDAQSPFWPRETTKLFLSKHQKKISELAAALLSGEFFETKRQREAVEWGIKQDLLNLREFNQALSRIPNQPPFGGLKVLYQNKYAAFLNPTNDIEILQKEIAFIRHSLKLWLSGPSNLTHEIYALFLLSEFQKFVDSQGKEGINSKINSLPSPPLEMFVSAAQHLHPEIQAVLSSWPQEPRSEMRLQKLSRILLDDLIPLTAAKAVFLAVFTALFGDHAETHAAEPKQLAIEHPELQSLLAGDNSFAIIGIPVPAGIQRSELRQMITDLKPFLDGHAKKIAMLAYEGNFSPEEAEAIYRDSGRKVVLFHGNETVFSQFYAGKLEKRNIQSGNLVLSRAREITQARATVVSIAPHSVMISSAAAFEKNLSLVGKQFEDTPLRLSPRDRFMANAFYSYKAASIPAEKLKQDLNELRIISLTDIVRFAFDSNLMERIQTMVQAALQILKAA